LIEQQLPVGILKIGIILIAVKQRTRGIQQYFSLNAQGNWFGNVAEIGCRNHHVIWQFCSGLI
jgi:hypothetical protein